MGRFDMHCHSHYSNLRLLDCISKVPDIVDRAVELGLAGVCLTDHECLSGHVEVDRIQQRLLEQGSSFKIARGNEIYLTDTRDKGQKYYHFILCAKNATGHKMLRELSSNSWINSYYDRGLERVPTLKSELEAIINKYGQGNMIASTACLGGQLPTLMLKMEEAEASGDQEGKRRYHREIVEFVTWCKRLFGDDFYFEVQPARSADQMAVNSRMPRLSKAFGVKTIVTTDAHYIRKEDKPVHRAYLNSKDGERETGEFYDYTYLQSTEEVMANLEGTGLDYAELEANTLEIYDKIENYSLARSQHVPQVEVKSYPRSTPNLGYANLDRMYSSDDPQERYWVNRCVDELKRRDLFNERYLERLEYEADVKKTVGDRLGTCMYSYPVFLEHYIDLFWECGSAVGAGRGSAGAGLNHMLLGITQVDPVKNDLPYWRYMNHDTNELGDEQLQRLPVG
jgi:DNA polymerase-3 subunit alpha